MLKEEQSDSGNKDNLSFQLRIKKESLYVFFLLALVNWISHYLYFMRFGLYEDDYANVGKHLGNDFSQLTNEISYRLMHWVQGHPLSFLPVLFAHIGDRLGGLPFLYVIAFIIVTVNSYLIYKILKKIFSISELFAISGALIFSLLPPDTMKMGLLSVYVVQMSTMFFLTATLLYLNGKKVISYMIILMSLFSYESLFMLFYGVPFLKFSRDKKFLKEYSIHFIVLSSMLGLMFVYRLLTGESRVVEANDDLIGVFTKVFAGFFIGPAFNLLLFVRAPIVTIKYLLSNNPAFWWYYNYVYYILIAFFIFFIWLFNKLKGDYVSGTDITETGSEFDLKTNDDSITVNEYFQKIFKIFAAGIILLCLGYALSFTHYPPIAVIGRITAVHLAGAFGATIIFSCICSSLFFLAERYKLKKYAVVIFSIYFSLLVIYSTYAQKEFVQSWIYQKSFWSKVVGLCPDLEKNTVVISLMPVNKVVTTRYVYSFSGYSDRFMFSFLYNFPNDWINNYPILNTVWGDWKKNLELTNDQWKLKSPYLPPVVLQDSNVIILVTNEKNEITRIDSSLTVNGKTLKLKPMEKPTMNEYKKSKIYELMIMQ